MDSFRLATIVLIVSSASVSDLIFPLEGRAEDNMRLVQPRCDEELEHSAGDCAVLGPGRERQGVCCNTLVCLEGGSLLGLNSQMDAAVGDEVALDEVCGHFELGISYLNWSISPFLEH